MPFLDSITQIINNQLKASTLSDSRFQRGAFIQIVNLIPREEGEGTINIPTRIEDIDGNEREMSFDDTYPFMIYHRVESITHADGDFRGDRILKRETANMLAVVFGDRNVLMLPQEQLITGVIAGFPTEISLAQKQAWNLSTAEIETGAVNDNPRTVYAAEVGGPYPLKPNNILFSVNYTIMTEYDPSCIDICNT